MFNWLKKTAKKADDTMDQVKNDCADTSEKLQKVLDESSESVKIIVKVMTIALVVSITANVINIVGIIKNHRKVPTISIQNLYLGDKYEV